MAKHQFYATKPVTGPLMRIMYAYQLFKPQENKNDKGETTLKYGCSLVLGKSGDWSVLRGLLAECVKGEWGEKGVDLWKSEMIRNPIIPGDSKQARSKKTGDIWPGLGSGVNFIRAGTYRKPEVYDNNLNLIIHDKDLPSGSWGYPVINAFAWDNPDSGKGISFGIEMFQLINKAEGDDILGGGGDAERAEPSKFFQKVDTGDAGEPPASASDLFAD